MGERRSIHVPAGTRHNLVNEGSVDLKLYTVYAPPQHAPEPPLERSEFW